MGRRTSRNSRANDTGQSTTGIEQVGLLVGLNSDACCFTHCLHGLAQELQSR